MCLHTMQPAIDALSMAAAPTEYESIREMSIKRLAAAARVALLKEMGLLD